MDIKGLVREPSANYFCGDSASDIAVLQESVVGDAHQNLMAATAQFEYAEVRIKGYASSETLVVIVFPMGNESKAIFRVFETSQQGAVRNVSFRLDTDISERILQAWEMGAEQDLIAHATVSEQSLCVLACDLNVFNVPFSANYALRSIPETERANFELDTDGSFLYWESKDIHLDLESLKVAIDPDLRARFMAEKIHYDRRYGKAIAAVRKSHKLKQTEIAGISARHIGRIEKGARPKLETLKKLAQGHGLEVNDYLNKVAQAMASIP
jgi:hypothetical protein